MILRAIWKRKESYSRLAEKVVSQIEFEIKQIDRLFELYAGLLERVQEGTPGLVDVTAVASVLHSFYNGLENVFLTSTVGNRDHRLALINQIFKPNKSRGYDAEGDRPGWCLI